MQQKQPTPHNAIIHVVIDERERNPRIAQALEAHDDVTTEVRRLPVGDYEVDDRLLVERKTLVDFGVSVLDGRLFRQANRLANQPRRLACVVLEGPTDEMDNVAISRPAFQGALITLTLIFGLPVLRSQSPEETASLILIAARQLWRREARAPRRRPYKITPLRRTQLLLLQTVPFVGPVTAAALLDKFGSPTGVACASMEELAQVPGVGPITADRLQRTFNDEDPA